MSKQQALSPLVLKILRLDHDGMSSEDIANEVKLSEGEIHKLLGTYRKRFFWSILESRKRKEAFLLDVCQGMSSKDLVKKYANCKAREFIIINIIGTDLERASTAKIRYRCNDCTNVLIFERKMVPYQCPRCGSTVRINKDD
jgi:DNA-directed RNA polymerase subunit RPC12/RpoP